MNTEVIEPRHVTQDLLADTSELCNDAPRHFRGCRCSLCTDADTLSVDGVSLLNSSDFHAPPPASSDSECETPQRCGCGCGCVLWGKQWYDYHHGTRTRPPRRGPTSEWYKERRKVRQWQAATVAAMLAFLLQSFLFIFCIL